MQLASPPGYGALSLLDRSHHAGRGLAPHVARFATQLHAIYVAVPEFVAAARTNPIVFGRDERQAWQPLLLVGLEPGRNLCVSSDGDWRSDMYCPAYVRRYPFCTALVAREGDEQKSVICVDEAGLGSDAPHLFDPRGEPTPRWREIQRFIEEVDLARRHTEQFCARLTALDLIENFEADIQPTNGLRKRLVGLGRVAEAKLNALAGTALAELMKQGALARIYAHLMSLDNFHRLLELDVAANQPAAGASHPVA